jgi:hypothetical protein
MEVNQKPDLDSDESSPETWRDSLWFILRWTMLITPFWAFAFYEPHYYGGSGAMLDYGIMPRYPFVYYAGIVLVISSPTLGLVLSVLLKRKRWPTWTVVIAALVGAGVSWMLGLYATEVLY